MAFEDIFTAVFADNSLSNSVTVTPDDTTFSELESCFAVTDLAKASIGAAGVAAARVAEFEPDIKVDRRLASMWFKWSIYPIGWTLPSIWDAVAGDYQTGDGWIRLHTNAPHHRKAAMDVLALDADAATQDDVREKCLEWTALDLESAIVANNGCAAKMHSISEWSEHPQGIAVSAEPLIHWSQRGDMKASSHLIANPSRPLEGIKVLDLTRVLAGPVATRFLAGLGADVLRVDPLEWEEGAVIPEITLGKRCIGLDLKDNEDRVTFEHLMSTADVMVHGYRSDALERLGYGEEKRAAIAPQLIDISLCAYGWTGPWATRRGFDSLVQMSSGIAHHGMSVSGSDKPKPLPVQALDHGAGYLLAAMALESLHKRRKTGAVMSAKTSLARVAELLKTSQRTAFIGEIPEVSDKDFSGKTEQTDWGYTNRLKLPLQIKGLDYHWATGARKLREDLPEWV